VLSSRRSGDRYREERIMGKSHHGTAMSMGASTGSKHASMLGMSMHQSHSGMTTMGGMAMSAGRGATNILPDWLAVIWTLVFLVIVIVHARHVIDSRDGRRIWHSGHVLMALGMLFMFAPGSLDHFDIPASFWQIVFANAAGIVAIWMLAQLLSGRAVNLLWGVIAIDFAAMVYMWTPSGFVAPITWLLVAYFGAGAVLWATNRMRTVDERPLFGGFTIGAGGTLSATRVEPLICEKDLRWSMGLMSLGMAYMFAAMQLLS
jgi:hypothetical protein